ncbi:MAG: DUF3656 domain-containing protein [Clostridia bacterium]|nr:DUF3656 domain-containing protein [Clostridia bacterium]MDD4048077.1 DUF3656 domain-containing protein [Clostridia bacterium]
MEKMELLAPVGSSEALQAAVQNGADAVYFGGEIFNARQYADNFSIDDIRQRVRYAHLYGVKVYMTVNTLVSNEEMPELIEYIYRLYNSDVDALIVQDLGVAYLIKSFFPAMVVHASTQMTIHNSLGVHFLKSMGISRVVLAREVSFENIESIGEKTTLELETFVHGALCVSYSGQCLMSSMIGGRSGNRGRCAQPCRLTYTLVDEKGIEIKSEGQHLLSPRDLKMIDHIPLLDKAKITSLKVEGRMKRPEYVATVIRNYRKAIDEYYENPDDYKVGEVTHKELAQVFNRDFTTGYFIEKPGTHLMSYQRPNNRGIKLGRVVDFDFRTKRVTIRLEEALAVGDGFVIWVTKGGRIAGEIKDLRRGNIPTEREEKGEVNFQIQEGSPSIGDRVFKTMDIELMEKARKTFINSNSQDVKKIPLNFLIEIKEGQPIILKACDNKEHCDQVVGQFIVEKARKHAATEEDIRRQLERLGNTVFKLNELKIIMDENVMVPLSELNNLRRDIVEKIEEMILQEFKKPVITKETYHCCVELLYKDLPLPRKVREKSKLSIRIGDMLSLKGALEEGADIIYFGGNKLRRKKGFVLDDFKRVVQECHLKGAKAVLIIPRIFYEGEIEKVKKYCLEGQDVGVDGFLTENPGALQLAEELDLRGVLCDYTLNIFNDMAVQLLLKRGVKGLTLSPELTLKQIRKFICLGNTSVECLVHGQVPLMLSEHCIIGNLLGKGHQEKGCPRPCLEKAYGLKDRLSMVFPIESDENCRTLLFNTKTLNMLDHLLELRQAGIGSYRIEARKEEAYWVKKVVAVYRQEIDRIEKRSNCKYVPLQESTEVLKSLSPGGFTTGHYYRGVE